MANKKLLTRTELAEELSMHVNTIDKLRKEGMPDVRIGKLVRFDIEDVIKWMKEER